MIVCHHPRDGSHTAVDNTMEPLLGILYWKFDIHVVIALGNICSAHNSSNYIRLTVQLRDYFRTKELIMCVTAEWTWLSASKDFPL